MMRAGHIFFSFFFFFTSHLIAQQNIPANDIIFDKEEDRTLRANTFFIVTDSLYNISKKKEYTYLLYAQKRSEENRDLFMLGHVYNRLGLFYGNIGLYNDAYQNYRKALGIFEQVEAVNGTFNVISNMATLHYYMGNFEKALKYEKQAAEFLQKNIGMTNYWSKLTNLYLNMGSIQGSRGKYPESRECFIRALEAYRKDPAKDSVTRSYIYNNLATSYMFPATWDTAYYFEKIAFDLKMKYGTESDKCDAYRNMAGWYQHTNDLRIQEDYYLRAKEHCDTVELTNDYLELLRELSALYEKKRDSYQAFRYLKKANRVKSYLDSVGKISELEQNELRGDYRSKVVSDSLQNAAQIKIKDMKISQQKAQSVLGSICLLVVSVLGIIAFRRYRMTRRQKAEIETQKRMVDVKNREITESINYARNLQEALIPEKSLLEKAVSGSFVFYEPKDIVAGDFYWWHYFEEKKSLLVCAADCTGHGVPGAMVSVVCINALNKAVVELGKSDPAEVLTAVNEIVNDTFGRNNKHVNDGMDVSLLKIDHMKKEVKWAGANNRLLYFDGALQELKPSKHSIGKSQFEKQFTEHRMELKTGNCYYLFTDGFADQFGGTKDKKMGFATFRKLVGDNMHLPMNEQETIYKTAFAGWKNGFEQTDDVTVMGIRI